MLKTRPSNNSQNIDNSGHASKKNIASSQVANSSNKDGSVEQPSAPLMNHQWTRLIQNGSTGPTIQRKCESCEQDEQDALALQPKLHIGPANDTYEQEADTVADVVMHKPGVSVGNISSLKQRQTSAKAESSNHDTSQKSTGDSSGLGNYVNSLNGKGHGMSRVENRFFSQRFNRSFDDVRLHTDSEANQAAKGIQAKAFTYGNHIVFNRGAYQVNQPKSMHLMAHELTHVVQQGGANGTLNKKPIDAVSHIQKTPEGELTPEQVGQDPGLLLCFILCEIGVPPSIWRTVTGMVLQAVWEEYKVRYSQAQANVAFRRFQLAFNAYSPIKVIQFILTFAVQGKIGLIPIRAAAATAIKRRLEAMLIARGATTAGLVAAEQIARKVVIVIEVAIAAGCGLYCGSMALGRAIVALTEAAAEGIVAFAEGLETAGEIMGSIVGGIATELFVRPIFTSLAVADIYNWDLAGMPGSTRADMLVMGWYLSSQLNGEDMDTLLTQIAKPINQYPNDFQDLIFQTMAEIASERDELNEEPLEFTPYSILRQSPIVFIRLLNEEGYLLFNQDPNDVADAMIYGGDEAETQD
ncbi:eCIS core domain-containing protein [Aliiglaciecola lipolytica]|uniref:eCIS core domain-containing protein n=1 Tax=Aliiglaciecola lipolytica E3 TaxID=1127673 RepID=K6Y450_9ALTE|nr:DUF4157 domain-containing protein [Aliiglaciecola lipolytica]GAC13042.1 hypothetical protein GLIP_0395 [Aliiglaciecola lipolytica E3]